MVATRVCGHRWVQTAVAGALYIWMDIYASYTAPQVAYSYYRTVVLCRINQRALNADACRKCLLSGLVHDHHVSVTQAGLTCSAWRAACAPCDTSGASCCSAAGTTSR
jgi:hypothetical protein